MYPYRPSLLVSPLDGTQFLHRADEYKSLLVGQHWYIRELELRGEFRIWVRPSFYNSAKHFLFVLLGWVVRWEVSGHTTAVLWGPTAPNILLWFPFIYWHGYSLKEILPQNKIFEIRPVHEYMWSLLLHIDSDQAVN